MRRSRALAAVVTLTISRALQAATGSAIYNFTNGADGGNPEAALTLDPAGNLFGTTTTGGANNSGVVFEINAAHTFKTITAFPTFTGVNGPSVGPSGLVRDPSGNLYGTTYNSGANGSGSIFVVNGSTGAYSTVISLNASSGTYPGVAGAPLRDSAGNLYGTTTSGKVYQFNPATSAYKILATFTGGSLPLGQLSRDGAGNLYGVTGYGGAYGKGTVFEISAANQSLTTLANFNTTNGSLPYAGILSDAAGNLYGTTELGGDNNIGTVFEIPASTRTLTTLVNFNGTNGQDPICNLIMDGSGKLFGTTTSGGVGNNGTVFEVDPATNAFNTVYTLSNAVGSLPESGVTADAAGNLYGTALQGGASNHGTVYELTGTGFVPIPVPEPTSLLFTITGAALAMRQRRYSR